MDTMTNIFSKNVSLKRLAWAYGCAKKGTPEEALLERELVARLRDPSELAKAA